MSPEARERSFDEMASGLASGGMSRLEALKWLGAALLGGALAFTPKVAEAAPDRWCYQRAGGVPRSVFLFPLATQVTIRIKKYIPYVSEIGRAMLPRLARGASG